MNELLSTQKKSDIKNTRKAYSGGLQPLTSQDSHQGHDGVASFSSQRGHDACISNAQLQAAQRMEVCWLTCQTRWVGRQCNMKTIEIN